MMLECGSSLSKVRAVLHGRVAPVVLASLLGFTAGSWALRSGCGASVNASCLPPLWNSHTELVTGRVSKSPGAGFLTHQIHLVPPPTRWPGPAVYHGLDQVTAQLGVPSHTGLEGGGPLLLFRDF